MGEGMTTLREAAQQALEALEAAEFHAKRRISDASIEVVVQPAITALRAALAEGAMQRLTDVHQEMDCYGDGNVYRGQRSSDSKTTTLTIKDNLTVEPVAYVTGYSKGYATVRPLDPCLLLPVGMALYRSPPQRKPLTNQEIMREYAALWRFLQSEDHVLAQDILKFARAIERAHGIGGEK